MLACGASLALIAPVAAPQAVYRCGDRYTAQPDPACPSAAPLDVADPRSAADRRDALEVDRRQKALADHLRNERHAREAMPVASAPRRSARATRSAAAASSAASGAGTSHGHAKSGTAGASAPQRPFTLRVPPRPGSPSAH